MTPETHNRVFELAQEFQKNVQARLTIGDAQAEYHAQNPKNEAYKLLLECGLTAKEAVTYFTKITI
jgi:hypothetical protein